MLTRWAGLPAAIPVGGLSLAALALVLLALAARRRRPVSDTAAMSLDRDAGTGGELRSARWFADRGERDDWADFHLATAAERLHRIQWQALYPKPRATREQLAAGVLIAGALAVIVTMPEQAASAPPATPAADSLSARARGPIAGRLLDPALQKRLEELLAAAAAGDLATAEALAADAGMRDLLNTLNQFSDAELLAALERTLAARPDAKPQAAVKSLRTLAEQARNAAEAGAVPKELQDALERLSDEIELASAGDAAEAERAGAESSGGAQQGQSGQTRDGDAGQELSIQFAKAADAGGGAGVMMMSSPDASQPGGPGGAGVGGAGSEEMAAAAGLIEAALKQETVEASQDSAGDHVQNEIRRKTEHGTATLGFTGAASATFDRTRATAPPPVPEARRSGVQTYFVRKPQ